MTTIVTRPSDDLVLPFRAERSGVSGRLVRLGAVADKVLAAHAYPEAVSKIVGEALILAAMLGATLKSQSRLTLQTSTNGAVNLVVADYGSGGDMRAYAAFDADKVRHLSDTGAPPEAFLGKGHLAMTIEPQSGRDRYQGIVALDGTSLWSAADCYFRQSEQLPTFTHVATARIYAGGANAGGRHWGWRAGGLIVQQLAAEGGIGAKPTAHPGEPTYGASSGAAHRAVVDDPWERTRILAASVQDHELLDPRLAPEHLLFRLFHEEGVRVFEPRGLQAQCRCSRERVTALLHGFSQTDLDEMTTPDGQIEVNCEFCSSKYVFERPDCAAP